SCSKKKLERDDDSKKSHHAFRMSSRHFAAVNDVRIQVRYRKKTLNMLISESHKFIFVHIQRTGGMSMTKLLQQHVPDLRQIHGRHGHVRDAIPELGDSRRQYFIFAMVRNPWDRLVSWHSMIRQEFGRLPWRQRWFSSAPMRHANWNQACPYL